MRLVTALAVLLLPVARAVAADDWTATGTPRQAHVALQPVPPVTLTPGKTAMAEIRFRVAPGFHVNSSKPTSELLIPTTVELSPLAQIKVAKVSYPPGQDFVLPVAPDEKLNVYSGDVTVTVLLSAAKPIVPGSYKLPGTLRYQACDDRSCFPPKSLALEIPVVIQSGK
jgi:hypothetical protein